jgi:carboxylesterase type B
MPPRTPNTPPQGGEKQYDEEGNEIQEQSASPAAEEETTEQLKARIARLEAALKHSDEQRVRVEEDASRLSAQAQSSMFTSNVTERFARKSDTGEDLWWYRIDLAPCGGIDIRVNGVQYVHGETYLFSTDLLRSVKEIVSRTWGHEANISGANENSYKHAQDRVLRGTGRR